MEKEEFLFLILGASYAAYKFDNEQRRKNLIANFKYNVHLFCNYDTDLTTYPEDEGVVHYGISDLEVMNLLWRDNKLPVWIDIYVIDSNEDFTTFELICAGRFSDKKTDYYYHQRGSGPFGIKRIPIENQQYNVPSRRFNFLNLIRRGIFKNKK